MVDPSKVKHESEITNKPLLHPVHNESVSALLSQSSRVTHKLVEYPSNDRLNVGTHDLVSALTVALLRELG